MSKWSSCVSSVNQVSRELVRLSHTRNHLHSQQVKQIWISFHGLLFSACYCCFCGNHTHTHTHPFNGPFSGTTQVSRYQKDKTNLDFTEARDSQWQWHQLAHMQVCTLLQTDNHASTPPLNFLQAGCPSCRPTNSVKALKALGNHFHVISFQYKHTCSFISENRCRLAVVQDLSFHGFVA